MDGMLNINMVWWITVVDIPALTGLLLLIWRTRRDNEEARQYLQDMLDKRTSQLREGLNAYKLESVKTYARESDLQALEERLITHLVRIEAKLDNTALKTEGLKAEKRVLRE
jgi:hypothetical protein